MKIGILAALDTELKKLFSQVKTNTIKDIGYTTYCFKLYDKEIYVIKTGVGNISSAQTCQYLITKFSVDVVINFGVCGILNDKLPCHKVLFVKNVVHYDFDLSAIENTVVGQYEEYDSYLIPIHNNLGDQFIEKFDLVPVNDASGDKFIADKAICNHLKDNFSCDICEMELAGINLTCIRNKISLISLKTGSDDASENNDYCDDIVIEKGSILFNKVLEIIKYL